MYTITHERKFVNQLTTLEKALRVVDKNEFLATKQKILGPEYNEKNQLKIWEDYQHLMDKAIHHHPLGEKDIECLERYRKLEGHFEILANETQLYFPTHLTRNSTGEIVKVDLTTLDNEITRRWFDYIHEISANQFDIRVCSATDCSMLYVRKGRKDQKFCSDQCRLREWRKQSRSASSI